jgi:aminopeptidase N
MAVTPGLTGGIEYPMHVMQGPGYIGRTTSHEIGHMWFYGLVHNDQGRDPWLDEGGATYAESRFEHTEGSMRSKSIPSGGAGHVGEPMTYWESRHSIYYRSVYVQGAQALMANGALDKVDCALRIYVARNAYRVARPADLIAAMQAVFPDAPTTMARFGARA